MSGVDAPPAGLRHDGIFYDDEATFFSSAVPFVRDGLENGEMVLVNTGSNGVTGLLRAMFSGEKRVVFSDRPVYGTPAAALESYRRTMDKGLRDGVPGFRAMGFIDFESGPLPWQEWLRYEAAVNRVFDGFPFQTLCPYDTTRLDPTITEAIRRAHPGLVQPDGWHRNEEYIDPEILVLEDGLVTPPHPMQRALPQLDFEHTTLRELRMEIYPVAIFTDLPRRKVDDLVAAVGEVATNAVRHGAGPVRVRVWAEAAAVTVTVTDDGPGIADPLAGFGRPRDPSHGLGLWAARQLSDILDYRRHDDGFSVRLVAFA